MFAALSSAASLGAAPAPGTRPHGRGARGVRSGTLGLGRFLFGSTRRTGRRASAFNLRPGRRTATAETGPRRTVSIGNGNIRKQKKRCTMPHATPTQIRAHGLTTRVVGVGHTREASTFISLYTLSLNTAAIRYCFVFVRLILDAIDVARCKGRTAAHAPRSGLPTCAVAHTVHYLAHALANSSTSILPLPSTSASSKSISAWSAVSACLPVDSVSAPPGTRLC